MRFEKCGRNQQRDLQAFSEVRRVLRISDTSKRLAMN